MPKGKFFVIDGTDGSGKKTQTERLILRMAAENLPVQKISFPQYGKKSAALVEEYLGGAFGSAEECGPRKASIFYAADRFAAAKTVREWLDAGTNVVADRYVASNMGHQGGKIADRAERLAFYTWNEELEYGTFGIPRPDLNVILHLPANIGQSLISVRDATQDIHQSDLGHLKAAESTYLEIARIFPGFKLVECLEEGRHLSVDEIHERVWETVKALLPVPAATPK